MSEAEYYPGTWSRKYARPSFHFGEWLRGRILALDFYVSKFVEVLDISPYGLFDVLNCQAVKLVEGDAEALARELGVPIEEFNARLHQAWNLPQFPYDDGRHWIGIRKIRRSSVLKPRGLGRSPSEDNVRIYDAEPLAAGVLDFSPDLVMC